MRTTDLEKMKARHAQQRAEAEAEIALAALLPLAPERVTSVLSSQPRAAYEVPAGEFGAFLAAFSPLEFSKWRGTYVSFGPACPKSDPKAAASGAYRAAICVQQGEGYGPTADLVFFAPCGDKIVRVDAKVCGLGYIDTAPVFGARFESEMGGRFGREVARYSRYANPLLEGASQGQQGPGWRERENKRQADYSYFFNSAEEATALIDAQAFKGIQL